VPIDVIRTAILPRQPGNGQHRIVAKLEKRLAKVEVCKDRLKKIPLILKRFRQSVLASACSGRLTADWREKNPDVEPAKELVKRIIELPKNKKTRPRQNSKFIDSLYPESWELVSTDVLFSFVTSGSRGWAKYYSDNGSLFIRIGNLEHRNISLDLSRIQMVNPPEGPEKVRTRIRPNDILISITADVGMVALVPEDIKEAYINQHIALARPSEGFCTKYLAWYLSSSEGGLKQFQDLQRGATKVGLGLDDIRNIYVPFPPLAEQHEIVCRVESLFNLADSIEARYETAKNYIDKLSLSILSKAFRGEFVPYDPSDEPASVLLERIREEREKSNKG